MVSSIRVYYEGDKRLAPSFSKFFTELRDAARAARCEFRMIAAGSGDSACRDFNIARKSHPEAWVILLRDSEGPDSGDLSMDLCRKLGWPESCARSVFWMVTMMEAWFHADKPTLKTFYGSGFRESALKANPKVEQIEKDDLVDGLRNATRQTKKGNYFENKASHSASLLALIDPVAVRAAAPNCERLFDSVLAELRTGD